MSITGSKLAIPVTSGGDTFAMVGNFPWRAVAGAFKNTPPTVAQVSTLLEKLRSTPEIFIAETPDSVPRSLYMALVGGGAHEALHRLLSSQKGVSAYDIHALVSLHWNGVKWSEHLKLLLDAMNIIEDIGIERIGNVEFPGIYEKLEYLSDFILDQEKDSREQDLSNPNVARIVFAVIRELGLGYTTRKNLEALAHYRSVCPEAYALVETGDLAPILERAIPKLGTPTEVSQSKWDLWNGSALAIAMDLVSVLVGKNLKDSRQYANGDSPSGKKKSSGNPMQSTGVPGDVPGGTPSHPKNPNRLLDKILWDYRVKGSGVLDMNSALGAAVKEFCSSQKMPPGESPYRPFSTSDDSVVMAPPTFRSAYEKMVAPVKETTSYIRGRLSTMFRSLELGIRAHGVPRGLALSNRMIVDTYGSIRAGQTPQRAFIEDEETIDRSMASVTVLDESSSMASKLHVTMGIAHALNTALESVSAKTMILGFRAGSSPTRKNKIPVSDSSGGSSNHHRTGTITYDIFKLWGESFQSVANRLGGLHSLSGTPMADGIEFALREISVRREAYRILFVITDGQPDMSHRPVVKAQIRRAREAGVFIVGVGLGKGSEYVETLFDDHVFSKDLKTIGPNLIRKLEEITRRDMTSKRGKPVSPT